MNQDRKRRYHNIVDAIMDTCPGGGTQDYVAHILENDGRLDEFADVMKWVSLTETVKSRLRHKRFDKNPAIPAFPSIEIPTGELDDEGNPKMRRVFKPLQKMLFEKDIAAAHQVIDAYIKRADANGRVANALVKVFAQEVPGFERELPFPDLDNDDDEAIPG